MITTELIVNIDSIRERINGLKAEIARVQKVDTRSLADVKSRIKNWVQSQAEQVDLLPLATAAGTGHATIDHVRWLEKEPLQMWCKLRPKEVVDALAAAAEGSGKWGTSAEMTMAQQESRLAELRAELLVAEVEEESMIMSLESAGQQAPPRRADVDPAALLAEANV